MNTIRKNKIKCYERKEERENICSGSHILGGNMKIIKKMFRSLEKQVAAPGVRLAGRRLSTVESATRRKQKHCSKDAAAGLAGARTNVGNREGGVRAPS